MLGISMVVFSYTLVCVNTGNRSQGARNESTSETNLDGMNISNVTAKNPPMDWHLDAMNISNVTAKNTPMDWHLDAMNISNVTAKNPPMDWHLDARNISNVTVQNPPMDWHLDAMNISNVNAKNPPMDWHLDAMNISNVTAKNPPMDWHLDAMNISNDFSDWNQDSVNISNALVLENDLNGNINGTTVPNGGEIDGSMGLDQDMNLTYRNGSDLGNLFNQNPNMPQCPVLMDILTSVFVFLLENQPNASSYFSGVPRNYPSSIQPGNIQDGSVILNPGDLPDGAIAISPDDLPDGIALLPPGDLPDGAVLIGDAGKTPEGLEIENTAEQNLKNSIFPLSETCKMIFSRSWVKSLYMFLVTTCIILALAGYIMFFVLPRLKMEILSPIFITIRSFMLVALIKVLLFTIEGIPACQTFPFELSTDLQCVFMHIRHYTENLLVTHVCLLSCLSLYCTVFKIDVYLNMKVTRISLAFIYIGCALLSMMYVFVNVRTCNENLSMTNVSDFIFLNALCITLVVFVVIASVGKPLKAFNNSQEGILKTQSRMSLIMMGFYATMYCPCQAMIVVLVIRNCPNEIPLMFVNFLIGLLKVLFLSISPFIFCLSVTDLRQALSSKLCACLQKQNPSLKPSIELTNKS